MSDAPGRPPGPAAWWIPTLLAGLAALATAGVLGLIEPTETRYAEIAREMVESGDWLTPRLDGLPHYDKPPLAYWATAAGMAVAGPNGWGARLPVALAWLLALGLTAWLVARRFESLRIAPAGVAWVLASMPLFAVLGRALAADPFLLAAVVGYWALAPSPWALAAIGAGFLAKGPVVFVHTALPVAGAALWARDRRYLALLGPPRGWLLFAAIALPWFVAAAARHPGLVTYWLGDQTLERFASEVHGRAGPPGYFVSVLLLGTAPWTVALIRGAGRTWWERESVDARLLLCWLFLPLAFFSFSGSKLPGYLLPAVPAAALLAARAAQDRASRWGAGVSLLAGAVTGLIAGGPALARAAGAVSEATPIGLVAACVLLALAGVAAAIGRVAATSLLVIAALTTATLAARPFESILGSPRRVVGLLAEQRGHEPVVEVGHFVAGVPFYLRERVPLLEVPRETRFASPPERRILVSRDSVIAWAALHGRVWTFGREARAREVAQSGGLAYATVARWDGKALGLLTPSEADGLAARDTGPGGPFGGGSDSTGHRR